MATDKLFSPADLVLKVLSGKNAGTLYPIKTQNCLLGQRLDSEGTQTSQCMIFRGPNGAAIKAGQEQVRVNGRAIGLEWLETGDEIQIGDSQLFVHQLGQFNEGCPITEPELPPSQANFESTKQKRDNKVTRQSNPPVEAPATSTSVNSTPTESAPSVKHLEAQIHEIRKQADNVTFQFEHLDARMDKLTQTLESLATAISVQPQPAPENEPAPAAPSAVEPSSENFVSETVDTPELAEAPTSIEAISTDVATNLEVNEPALDNDAASPDVDDLADEKRLKPISEISKQIHFELLNRDDDSSRLEFPEETESPLAANASDEAGFDLPSATDVDAAKEFPTDSHQVQPFDSQLERPASELTTDSFSPEATQPSVTEILERASLPPSANEPAENTNSEVSEFQGDVGSQTEQVNSLNAQPAAEADRNIDLDSIIQSLENQNEMPNEPSTSENFGNEGPAALDSMEPFEPIEGSETSLTIPTSDIDEESSFASQVSSLPEATETAPPENEMSNEAREESVSELLARMGYNPEESEEADSETSPEPGSSADVTISNNLIQDSKEDDEVETSVEAYMNRLLGKSESTQQIEVEEEEPKEESFVPELNEEPMKLLSPSEFKPSRAPEKISNLAAMRELANQSNRVALDLSSKQRAKAIAITNFSVMGLGISLSAYLLYIATGMLSPHFFLGTVTLALSFGIGSIGFRSLNSINPKPEPQEQA